MTLPRRLALTIAIVLLTAAVRAGSAAGGEYAVFACEPLAGDANNAWVVERNHGGVTAFANCPPAWDAPSWNRGLVARAGIHNRPGATVPTGAYAQLIFRAPPGTSLSRIAYTHEWCGGGGFRAGLVNGAGVWLRYAGPNWCGSFDPPQYTLGLGGTNSIQLVAYCMLGPCSVEGGPYGRAALRSATVWIADHSPPGVALAGGSALSGKWLRGVQQVYAGAADNVGIRATAVNLADKLVDSRSNTCNYTLPVPCPGLTTHYLVDTRVVPDGRRSLAFSAHDAAGNGNVARASIGVDNTAPVSPRSVAVVGGSGWRAQNSFTLSWRNPSQHGTAPISGAQIALCPASTPPEKWTGCAYRTVSGAWLTSASNLKLPGPGAWNARISLRDAAGNFDWRTAQSVLLRYDDTPPVLAFLGQSHDDPGRIMVRGSDATSPLWRAEIEIRRRGSATWRALTTARTATGFSAYVDDERLADGTYDIRARAVDSAGNERSIDRGPDGAPATRTVPLRIDTRLVAGQVKQVTARRSRGGKRRTRRIIVVRPIVHFGQTIPIRGRLTTPGANPVAKATVEVWQRFSLPDAAWRRIAVIGTGRRGRFKFKALRGPSRVLRFRYPGTALVRARTREVVIQVKAGSTMRSSADRVVNGGEVVFRGRVLGRPLPATGKLVQLQAYSRGRWLTFATPRADAQLGAWQYRYRFTATRGTVRYRFRARLPREATFPYGVGTSRTVRVTVRGL